jgi:hypothetical protein
MGFVIVVVSGGYLGRAEVLTSGMVRPWILLG